ncbi:hypothetical protein ID850_14550 [Xenorhabdus sp. Flor]|uniref:hypothetical protein n=1 Tax=Xenorhabdus cabanillasii TaxID=351673 RepID=UPI00199AB997|nr:hypothetical protein [Xenorhabdus sp. Flor]MBD2815956.1 hypothetical protein [Xenorhabdus sp. Flor]
MPKHIHADLIMEYARLAQETDRPWEYFEYAFAWEVGRLYWEPCKKEIVFKEDMLYRLKPRTIKIGEIDVPEPVRDPLEYGTEYWHVDFTEVNSICASGTEWEGDCIDKMYLEQGLIHLARESAELHARALISLTSK